MGQKLKSCKTNSRFQLSLFLLFPFFEELIVSNSASHLFAQTLAAALPVKPPFFNYAACWVSCRFTPSAASQPGVTPRLSTGSTASRIESQGRCRTSVLRREVVLREQMSLRVQMSARLWCHGRSSSTVLPRSHQQEGVRGAAGSQEQGWSLPDPRQRDHPGSHVSVCLVSNSLMLDVSQLVWNIWTFKLRCVIRWWFGVIYNCSSPRGHVAEICQFYTFHFAIVPLKRVVVYKL